MEFQEGGQCQNCGGIFGYEKVSNCSCHISPPCQACVENTLVCLTCGYDPIYSLEEWNKPEEIKTKKIKISLGYSIGKACKDVVDLANKDNTRIEFDFNGQTITALPNTNTETLVKIYKDESDLRYQEYINSDEYKRKQAAYKRKELEKKEKLNIYLKDAPVKMTLKDESGWIKACEANTDPYGNAVIVYAETWARLMEVRMSAKEQLQTIADECSHLADIEGLTGYMYGCAVSILSSVWIHGEELRKWHNISTQLSNEGEKANAEGGILNPALLRIGKD